MELNELNDNERIALVALIDVMVESDTQVTDEEMEKLQAVVDAVGTDEYEAAADAVDERFGDEDDLRAFLPSIERQEARELIYGTVLELAMSENVDPHEGHMLTWLAEAWKVSVQTDESDTPK